MTVFRHKVAMEVSVIKGRRQQALLWTEKWPGDVTAPAAAVFLLLGDARCWSKSDSLFRLGWSTF